MKIKLVQDIVVNQKPHFKGEVVDVSDFEAKLLIKEGSAVEYVEEKKEEKKGQAQEGKGK